jgi:hypothetical protein
VGPTILTAIHGATGKYEFAFVAAFAMALLGLGLTVVYRHMVKK